MNKHLEKNGSVVKGEMVEKYDVSTSYLFNQKLIITTYHSNF